LDKALFRQAALQGPAQRYFRKVIHSDCRERLANRLTRGLADKLLPG
jgi:hypothetical protein